MPHHDSPSVLITGGTSGIGLATAALLRDAGARVTVTGRHTASLDEARAELGAEVSVLRSDISSLDDIDELVAHLTTEPGHLDLIVANAGVTAFVPFSDMTPQAFDDIFGTNARGTYFLVQRLAPLLAAGSSVVIVTSVADVKGLAGSSAYAASKAAARSMVRSLARELQPQGVRVNAVSPGPIDTGILERSMSSPAATSARAVMTANNPMGRFGQPHEVAAAIRFLAFDATFTTGAELPVDGGASQL